MFSVPNDMHVMNHEPIAAWVELIVGYWCKINENGTLHGTVLE